MLKCPEEFEEDITFRYLPEHKGSYAYCDGPSKRIEYFIGPGLLFIYFLKLHERYHATTWIRYHRMGDCDNPSCVMAKNKSIKTVPAKIKRRWNTGCWYCEECQKEVPEVCGEN